MSAQRDDKRGHTIESEPKFWSPDQSGLESLTHLKERNFGVNLFHKS